MTFLLVLVLLAQVATVLAVSGLSKVVFQQKEDLMNALDALIKDLDANTNAVAARLDTLTAELQAQGGTATPAQLAQLGAISDHLKSLGADPSQPIPGGAEPPPPPPANPNDPPAGG